MDIIQHSFIWNRCVNRLLLGKEQKMTREQAIEIIRKEYACVDADCDIERNCGRCELHMPSKEPILKAYEMAILALSQEPISLNDINNALEASFRNGVRSAKVQKSGKWINDECGNVICSECKRFRRDCRFGHTNYCNHCGARMYEPQESEEISERNMKMWEEIFKAERGGKE